MIQSSPSSDASQWRLCLARQITQGYVASPSVDAVLLIGSVSRGWADAYSDIELGVFWRGDPTDAERQTIVGNVGGMGWHPSPYDGTMQAWGEDYTVKGVKIDLGHWKTDTMEQVLSDVIDGADASLPKQTSVSAIQHGLPLHGRTLIERWQARAHAYPAALGEAMVRPNLTFNPLWTLRMLAERDDFLLLHQNLCAQSTKLLLACYGLNQFYYPGHKWVHRQIEQMRIRPTDFAVRLRRTLAAEPLTAVEEMRSLTEETFVLATRHMPAVDTATAAAHYLQPPHFWAQPPTDSGGVLADGQPGHS
jgi:hypothetical protein